MILRNNSSIDVNELMTKINEQISGSEAASLLDAENAKTLSADAVTAVANMESFIQYAEAAARVRTSWGSTFNRFPFNLAPFRIFFLRLLAFLFRDQRQVNIMLIDALRASLRLNIRLCEQVDTIRVSLDALERSPTKPKRSVRSAH